MNVDFLQHRFSQGPENRSFERDHQEGLASVSLCPCEVRILTSLTAPSRQSKTSLRDTDQPLAIFPLSDALLLLIPLPECLPSHLCANEDGTHFPRC